MATKRTVELSLKIQGAATLGEMEQNLADINEELRQVDVNSQAFEDLSAAAREADGQVRTLNDSLEGVTSLEKSEGAAKLADGLVGGFAAATVAASLFGEEAEDAAAKALAQAAQLFVFMDGLKKVTEAFSAQNVKAYRAIVKGIKESTIATKLFGSTTRTILSSLGIGLLIAAIGLIVSNWEAVTEAVRDFADSIPLLKPILDFFDDFEEKVGSIGNLFKALGAGIKGLFTAGTSFAEQFGLALEEAIANDKVQQAFKNIEDRQDGINAKTGEYKATLEKINRSHAIRIKQLQNQLELEDDIEKQKKIQLKLDKEIASEQSQIANAGFKFLNKNSVLLKEQEDSLEARIIGQRKIVNDLNQEGDAKEKQKEIEREVVKLKEQSVSLDEKLSANAKKQFELLQKIDPDTDFKFDGGILNLFEATKKVKDEIGAKVNSELVQDLTKLEVLSFGILNTYNETNDNLKEQTKLLNDITKQSKEQIEEQEILNELLQKQSDIENIKLNVQLEYLQSQLLSGKISAEEARIIAEQLALLKLKENSIKASYKLIEDTVDLEKVVTKETKEQLKLIKEVKILTTQERQNKIREIAQQQSLNDLLIDGINLRKIDREASDIFLDEFEIRATEILNNIADVTSSAFNAALQFIQNGIDKTQFELDSLETAEEKSLKRQERLREQLADANGDRHKDLLAQLKEEEAASTALASTKSDLEFKLAEQKHAQAKWEKAQAIVDASIATALAVVQALPIIPLSIAVGVLGAAGVVAIASQPLPPAPKREDFAEGGHTGDGGKYQPAGIVHKGEYVIPQDVLSTQQGSRMAATLEAMRTGMRGYVDGGEVVAPDSVGVDAETQTIVTALENATIVVSVQEINDVNTNVRVIESKASL